MCSMCRYCSMNTTLNCNRYASNKKGLLPGNHHTSRTIGRWFWTHGWRLVARFRWIRRRSTTPSFGSDWNPGGSLERVWWAYPANLIGMPVGEQRNIILLKNFWFLFSKMHLFWQKIIFFLSISSWSSFFLEHVLILHPRKRGIIISGCPLHVCCTEGVDKSSPTDFS